MISLFKNATSVIFDDIEDDTVTDYLLIKCSSSEKAINVSDKIWKHWNDGDFWNDNAKYPTKFYLPQINSYTYTSLKEDSQIAFDVNFLENFIQIFCLSYNHISHIYSSVDKLYRVIVLSSQKTNVINGFYRFEIIVDPVTYSVKVKYTKCHKLNNNFIGNISKISSFLGFSDTIQETNKKSINNALQKIQKYTYELL